MTNGKHMSDMLKRHIANVREGNKNLLAFVNSLSAIDKEYLLLLLAYFYRQ